MSFKNIIHTRVVLASNPDTECDLDYVPNKARDLNAVGGVEVCLSNGFGFGGQNDCVCVRKFA